MKTINKSNWKKHLAIMLLFFAIIFITVWYFRPQTLNEEESTNIFENRIYARDIGSVHRGDNFYFGDKFSYEGNFHIGNNHFEIAAENDIYNTFLEVYGYMESDIENIGLCFYDLHTNEYFSINKDTKFRSASTTKIFVNMALMEIAYNDDLDLETLVYFDPQDYEAGTGLLQRMDLNLGYRLRILSEFSIKYSDNIAYRMIRRYLGDDVVFDYLESITGAQWQTDVVYLSANEAMLFMKHLYETDIPTFEMLINNMKNTDFDDMISKYIPHDDVAHKIGYFHPYYHDIGIVYTNNSDFILSIYTKNLSQPHEKVGKISQIIYENLSN